MVDVGLKKLFGVKRTERGLFPLQESVGHELILLTKVHSFAQNVQDQNKRSLILCHTDFRIL